MGCCGNQVEDISTKKDGTPLEFDPNFKGPMDKRSCTDILCFLLFGICVAAFVALGLWAISNGDPKTLLYPTDSNGNKCGYGAYSSKPYLFFFDMLDCAAAGASVLVYGCPTPQVCISSCPSEKWTFAVGYLSESSSTVGSNTTERAKMICLNGVDATDSAYSTTNILSLVTNEKCAAYYLDSVAVAGRCVPKDVVSALNAALNATSGTTIQDKYNQTVSGTRLQEGSKYLAYAFNIADYGTKILQDVRASWWMILVGIGIGMFICFVWMLLLRCLAGLIVWLSLILFTVIFGGVTGYCFYKYYNLKQYPSSSSTLYFTTNVDYYLNLTYTWLAFGCMAGLCFLIVLVIIIFLRKRVLLAVALIKVTASAMKYMYMALVWPLIPFVMQLIVLIFWGTSTIFLASMGDAQYELTKSINKTVDGVIIKSIQSSGVCDISTSYVSTGEVCAFAKYAGNAYIASKYLQFFLLFMFLWIANFIIALGQMTMAGSFASYYWAFNKPADIPKFPVTTALWRALRYHIGTMAFGALIIAIIQMIRILLEYLDRKLKGKENAFAKFLIKCLKCCFWCLEKVIKFINKNAYILVSIYGYNFCRSAVRAFSLIARNIIRIAVVDKVTDFVLFVSKLVVTGAIVAFGWVFFSGTLYKYLPANSITDYVKSYTPSLNFYLTPVIVIAIGTFLIATVFFSVYSMGVETMFLCFLEDEERNDGSPAKPYFGSKDLLKVYSLKNSEVVEKARE